MNILIVNTHLSGGGAAIAARRLRDALSMMPDVDVAFLFLDLHPSEAQHGDLGIVCPNDLMLLISNSGKTREILELVELSRRLVPGIPYICITSDTESVLAQNANIVLHTGSPKEVCPLGLTPTTSTTVMTVMGDLLVVGVMEAIGFSYSEYSKRHHGGYLGSKSRAKSEEL